MRISIITVREIPSLKTIEIKHTLPGMEDETEVRGLSTQNRAETIGGEKNNPRVSKDGTIGIHRETPAMK